MLTYGAASYSSADFLLRVSAALTYGGWGLRILFVEKGKKLCYDTKNVGKDG